MYINILCDIYLSNIILEFTLDKNQTKELINSFKLILLGIFFWLIKIRYITFFLLPEYHFLNVIGLEIVGTILIMIGILIIHRVYPFVFSLPAILLIFIIFTFNVLDFFLFRFKLYRTFQQYIPFVMSLMLMIISKLMESGIRYFGNIDLSKKWRYIAIIIFYGFSVPFYIFVSLNILGYIEYDFFQFRPKVFLLFSPVIILIIYLIIYYLVTIISSLRFLSKIQEEKFKS